MRRWDFGLVPSERSLEAVGKSVRLHIIGRSKVFDLFPRTHKGKNRRVLRGKHALINSRERTQKSDINLEQSSHVETVVLLSREQVETVQLLSAQQIGIFRGDNDGNQNKRLEN